LEEFCDIERFFDMVLRRTSFNNSILIKETSIQQLLIILSNNSGGSDPAPCPFGQAGPIRSQHAKGIAGSIIWIQKFELGHLLGIAVEIHPSHFISNVLAHNSWAELRAFSSIARPENLN
jgi:hypothetical protein